MEVLNQRVFLLGLTFLVVHELDAIQQEATGVLHGLLHMGLLLL